MATKHQLNEELNYLYSLERFGIKLGLEVMQQLLAALGNPHLAFKSVHITGTNGKGSTASFIERVLREAGQTVGLYTSPHLYRFNERVKTNGREISDTKLLYHIARVRQAALACALQPTFFEFTTAIAFLEFARQRVDIAVVEVGMGGELDATNVIVPAVAVITNIGLDHTPMLGTTKAAITANKAGIIKDDCDVVTAEVDQSLRHIIEQVCTKKHATFYEVDQEFTISDRQQTLVGQTFLVRGSYSNDFKIALRGKHQIRNACTALLTLMRLQQRGWQITDAAIERGFALAVWPGRLDIVSRKPFILMDGAHNNDGVESLAVFLDEMKNELPPPSVLVVAAKKGKNVGELREKIATRFSHIIVTQGNYEPMPAQELTQMLQGTDAQIEIIPDVAQAIAYAKELQAIGSMMLVTGSLYMIGDALKVIARKT